MGYLIPQRSDRDDLDPVFSCIGHFSASDNHEQIRLAEGDLCLFFVVLLDKLFELKKVGCTIFYFFAAQLELDQRIAPVI